MRQAEAIIEDVMTENFAKLKGTKLHIQKSSRNIKQNTNKTTPQHITVKLLKKNERRKSILRSPLRKTEDIIISRHTLMHYLQ